MSVRKHSVGSSRRPVLELLFDLEQVEFAEIEQPHDCRLETADLAHQLRADRAPGTGHQNPLAAEAAADTFCIELDFLPANEVLQPHFPYGVHGDAPFNQLANLGNGTVTLARPVAEFDDAPHHVAPRRGDGDEDLIERDGYLLNVVDCTQDGYAVDCLALLAGVVVKEPHGTILDPWIVEDLAQHLLGGIPCAHDEQPLPLFTVRFEEGEIGRAEEAGGDGPLYVDPDKQPYAANEYQGEQSIQDEDTSGKPLKASDENQGQCDDPRADHR